MLHTRSFLRSCCHPFRPDEGTSPRRPAFVRSACPFLLACQSRERAREPERVVSQASLLPNAELHDVRKPHVVNCNCEAGELYGSGPMRFPSIHVPDYGMNRILDEPCLFYTQNLGDSTMLPRSLHLHRSVSAD